MIALWITILGALCALAYVLQLLRWLRVVQREDYDPTSLRRFWNRWAFPPSASAHAVQHTGGYSSRVFRLGFSTAQRAITSRQNAASTFHVNRKERRAPSPLSIVPVIAFGMILALATRAWPLVVFFVWLFDLVFPWGLRMRGRDVPMSWNRRLRSIAFIAVVLSATLMVPAIITKNWVLFLGLLLATVPVSVNLAVRLHNRSRRHLEQQRRADAAAWLAQSGARVILLVGSASTSITRRLLEQLCESRDRVRSGQSICHNDLEIANAVLSASVDNADVVIVQLTPARPGVATALAAWLSPHVVTLDVDGACHMDRFASQTALHAELREFARGARAAVLVGDRAVEMFRQLPLATPTRTVTTTGDDILAADDAGSLRVRLNDLDLTTPMVAGVAPAAVGAAVAVIDVLYPRSNLTASMLETLLPVASAVVTTTVNDDILVVAAHDCDRSSDAQRVLTDFRRLTQHRSGRRIVVTPGIIDLGVEQNAENFRLGAIMSHFNFELVCLGRTNAESLLSGHGGAIRRYDHRDEALEWLRRKLQPGDSVVHLARLPDYYP